MLAVLLSVLMTCGRENGKKSIAAQSNNAMFPRLFHHKLLGNIGGRGVHLSTVPSLTSGAKHSEVTAVWGEDADPLNSGIGGVSPALAKQAFECWSYSLQQFREKFLG